MYAAIYRCKLCNKMFPFAAKNHIAYHEPTDESDISVPFTPYETSQVVNRFNSGLPHFIPHICERGFNQPPWTAANGVSVIDIDSHINSNSDSQIGVSELVGFMTMEAYMEDFKEPVKPKRQSSSTSRKGKTTSKTATKTAAKEAAKETK